MIAPAQLIRTLLFLDVPFYGGGSYSDRPLLVRELDNNLRVLMAPDDPKKSLGGEE